MVDMPKEHMREQQHCTTCVSLLCTWLLQVPSVCADMQAFKAMMRRESTLIQRTLFVYIFKAVQVSMPCSVTYSATDLLLFVTHEHCCLQFKVEAALACTFYQTLGLKQRLHALCTPIYAEVICYLC